MSSPSSHHFRLSPRDLMIIVLSVAAGIATEALLTSGGVTLGQAVVAAGAAFAGTFYFLDRIVDPPAR